MNDNIIFLHIPKNGGSTFRIMLPRLNPNRHRFEVIVKKNKLNTDEFINLPENERSKISLISGHFAFGIHNHLFGESKYIAFLRNPEDRIISFYYYVLSLPQHRLYNNIKNENMSLYNFVTTIKQGDVNNAQIRKISGINDTENSMLEKALENIEHHFSFVGLVERFNESLILLKNIYGWETPYYRIKNKTKNRLSTSALDNKTRDAIHELNRGDYLLYDEMESRFQQLVDKQDGIKMELIKLKLYNKIYSSPVIRKVVAKAKKIIS